MKDYGMDIFAQCIGGKVVFVNMPLFIKSPQVRSGNLEDIDYIYCSRFVKNNGDMTLKKQSCPPPPYPFCGV